MTLPPLATSADMEARGISPDRYTAVSLAVASAAVREAAGVPISVVEADIRVPGTWGVRLSVPSPAIGVDSVAIDGVAISDFAVWPSCIWRSAGWGSPASVITMRLTTGTEVPVDIVQLVCELAVLFASSQASDSRIASESVDDYSAAYRADSGISAIELPELTRARLRARFSPVSTVGVLS